MLGMHELVHFTGIAWPFTTTFTSNLTILMKRTLCLITYNFPERSSFTFHQNFPQRRTIWTNWIDTSFILIFFRARHRHLIMNAFYCRGSLHKFTPLKYTFVLVLVATCSTRWFNLFWFELVFLSWLIHYNRCYQFQKWRNYFLFFKISIMIANPMIP